jgi:hypothetical protein
VNQNKKVPFTKWLATGTGSLADIVRGTEAGRILTDEGCWANIEASVVQAYEDIAEESKTMHTQTFVGELNTMLTRMEIM